MVMKRPWVLVTLTLFFAVAAGVLVFWFVSGADQRAMEQQEPATIVIAQQIVPQGTSLGEAVAQGLVAEERIPASLRPMSALAPIDATTSDLVVLADVPAGQTLMAASVGVVAEGSEALTVPDGQLAVTVLLDDPSKVGAFLRPGSHVAVFDTYAPVTTGEADVVLRTQPLLDDVVVLAIGPETRTSASDADPEAWNAQLVTVAVTQAQAERLVHASRTGALHLALLGEGTALVPSTGVSDLTLFPSINREE
jgi:pilus assembly protein CpaB